MQPCQDVFAAAQRALSVQQSRSRLLLSKLLQLVNVVMQLTVVDTRVL